MIQTTKPWSPEIKEFLQHASWNQADTVKNRWLGEMNNQDNVSASVKINLSERTILLTYDRQLAETGYTAGKLIQITEFDSFCFHFPRF